MSKIDETDEGHIAPNLRTLAILEVLGTSDKAMTPTQINEHLGLPKQTIHRLCKTLLEEGFLIGDTLGKGLRPSRRSRHIAVGILNASRHHIARHQILKDLSSQLGETVNFVVPEDEGMSYKDRVETDWAFRVQLPIGSHVPFHCTASGKVFLASLSRSNRRKILDALNLKAMTPNTITSHDVLERELVRINKQGYAIDNEEFLSAMIAIAVPITDANGRFVAAIATHCPTMRMSMDDLVEHTQLLRSASLRLSAAILD